MLQILEALNSREGGANALRLIDGSNETLKLEMPLAAILCEVDLHALNIVNDVGGHGVRDLKERVECRPLRHRIGMRAALFEAGLVLLTNPRIRWSPLKAWGVAVAKRRGMRKAVVAVARKLGIVLHRMWRDGADFRWSKAA